MKSLHLLAIAASLAGCALDRTAGGSGSETTNTVQLAVVDASGRPVLAARALVRSESDTTTSGTTFEADEDGIVQIPAPAATVWVEVRAPDGSVALTTVSDSITRTLRSVVRPASNLVLSGFAPGQLISLPGLGRTAVAGSDGVARFESLPTGAARARWTGFDGPVPLPVGDTGKVVRTDSSIQVGWPADGSQDSVALRRFLDVCRMKTVSVASVASPIEGRLAHLDLSRRGLDSLPSSVSALDFVREIDLRGNRLAHLPSTLPQMPRLSFLDLAANPFAVFPQALRGTDSMRILDLDSTGIAALPSWLGELSNLWYLSVAWNKLDSLPASLIQLKRLAILGIYRNRIATFPDGMGAMDSLREIWAETNQLRRLPSGFTVLPNLRTLQLDNNLLDSLPSDIGSLPSLRDLRLTGTDLHTLPASLSKLPLTRLDVEGLSLCTVDPLLEPKLDSLAGPDWRSARQNGCP